MNRNVDWRIESNVLDINPFFDPDFSRFSFIKINRFRKDLRFNIFVRNFIGIVRKVLLKSITKYRWIAVIFSNNFHGIIDETIWINFRGGGDRRRISFRLFIGNLVRFGAIMKSLMGMCCMNVTAFKSSPSKIRISYLNEHFHRIVHNVRINLILFTHWTHCH